MQKMTITEATTREPGASDGAGLTLPRAQSLAAQVAEFIVDGIASGAFQFGQRLVETDLARQLNVSRVPIREAIKMLEAQGILLVIPHRGAYIAEFDERKIERICQARAALENLALPDALAALRTRPERLASLETLIARMERAYAEGDWAEAGRADLEFHRQICLASDNEIVITLWEALARHIAIVFGRELAAERGNPRLAAQHRRIVELFRKGDLAKLDDEIRRHIMRLRGGRS
jgi:DNA-binding GntR family transcriptional regulator